MPPRRALIGFLLGAIALLGPMPPMVALSRQTQPSTAANILAPVGRQVGWLNLEAPRPRILTRLAASDAIVDVAAAPGAPFAALAVASEGDAGQPAASLVALDLSTGELRDLVRRSGPESLTAPVWLPFGGLLFQREDLTRGPASITTTTSRSTARVEIVQSDGTGRTVLIQDAHFPAPTPDGGRIAFVRSSDSGVGIYVRTYPEPSERVLVLPGYFSDVSYLRFAPHGERLAFMASGGLAAESAPGWASLLPFVSVAYAHGGTTWDLWVTNSDGSGLRRLPQLGSDDGSVSWSPDGMQLFVYGGTGAFLVDAATGESASMSYISGYGSTAWLPDAP